MKVLLAEDEAVSRLILRKGLERLGHECFQANDGLEALDIFSKERPDVVISDWVMPGMDGIELCKRVRELPGPYTYFVFLTSLKEKTNFLDGMKAGADDYLVKPVDMDELTARMIAASRVTSLHRKLVEQNAELERLGKLSYEAARHDPLTKVANRLKLREDLEGIAARVKRYGARYAAGLVDVDEFKKYNDKHGHLAGDEALRAVADAMKSVVREGDAIYRYGGEEFLVLLPEQDEKGAMRAMERVRAAVEGLKLQHLGKTPNGVVTISSGVALLRDSDAPPFESWFKRADEALYRAKAGGRNRVEIEP